MKISEKDKGRPLAVTIIEIVVLAALVLFIIFHFFMLIESHVILESSVMRPIGGISEDLTEFTDYCNSIGTGSYEITSAWCVEEKAYIFIDLVDSLEESNELILVMRDFFIDHPNYVLNHRHLEILMRTDEFYVEYYWDTPSDSITRISIFSFNLPEKKPQGSFIDVQSICVSVFGNVSEDRIEILQEIYPNAEIQIVNPTPT